MATEFENRYAFMPGDESHLGDYLQTLLSNWRPAVVITLLALMLGATYAFLATPVYQADVMFHVVDKTDSGPNDKGGPLPVSGMFDTKPSTAAEIELLRSRLVTEETVKALHLDITAKPRKFPLIAPLLGNIVNGKWGFKLPSFINLSSYAWGNETIAVSRFDTNADQYDRPFTVRIVSPGEYVLQDPDGATVLEGKVGEPVQADTAAGPIALQIDTLTGPPGMRFELSRASTLTTVERLRKQMEVAESTLQSGIIRASLEGHDPRLTTEIINFVARRFIQQDVASRSAEVEHMLGFLDQQMPQLRAELDAAEQRYNKFRNEHGTVDLGEESKLLLQQIVDNKTRLADLQNQRLEMSQRFTPNHPTVAALDAQIGALQAQQSVMNRSVAGLPGTEQTALRLLRDVHVNTELYTNLLNSAQQLRIARAGQVGDVRVVDFAEVPDDPVRPKKLIVMLIALGAGLFISVIFAFVRKTLYGGVERPDEIENVLGVPVFAVVPRSEQQLRLQNDVMLRRRGLHVLAEQSPQDIAVEGVRSLRTTLQLLLGSSQNNVVMLTGSRPDAGKSFLSVNLAALVASANQRVLIVDGDMRRGDVHSHFGITHQPGLSDVLRGGELRVAIRRDVLPGLDVLPKGSLPSHPSELLMSANFSRLLDTLKAQYDVVIIDTPPVLAVTDSTVIGKHAATTLLVTRFGRNPVNELVETAKRLRNGGVNLKGVLLTDVPQAAAFLGSTGYRGGIYQYDSIAG
ncbi:polysaccharide biosynthesis tyrosine autokinase [Paraburkholderia sp.]|uniref:polysaccharide biosynthesis tyrosine autokinase n=1 Tax=Paraburkholderia sp. TaxID=1926495 RepID=UPI00238872EA|nr:polysaccharide biosynthesis tyrosine autokinase [Paraburkholderia sp.]MDE1183032.1 polysaccharide biosynthesis tyrosine autokinase [Paraburkholderia sp.]